MAAVVAPTSAAWRNIGDFSLSSLVSPLPPPPPEMEHTVLTYFDFAVRAVLEHEIASAVGCVPKADAWWLEDGSSKNSETQTTRAVSRWGVLLEIFMVAGVS